MLAMVSGLGRLRAQPLRRLDLPRRAVAPARADDHQQHRPAQLAAGQGDAVRDRCRPSLLGRDALARRLGRQAVDAEVRAGMNLPELVETPPAADPATVNGNGRPPGSTPPTPPTDPRGAAWRTSDRIGLAICWALGLLFCAIAVVDRRLHASSRASSTCGPSCSSPRPKVGFTQDADRRLLRRADRHVRRLRDRDGDRDAGRDRRSRSGSASTAGPSRSPGSPSRRSR